MWIAYILIVFLNGHVTFQQATTDQLGVENSQAACQQVVDRTIEAYDLPNFPGVDHYQIGCTFLKD